MEDAVRARRERLLKGKYGHVATAEEHVQALLKEQSGASTTALESITNQLLQESASKPLFSQHLLNNTAADVNSENTAEDEGEELYAAKIDWDLKREWSRQHKPLAKETQKAYRTLLKQRLSK